MKQSIFYQKSIVNPYIISIVQYILSNDNQIQLNNICIPLTTPQIHRALYSRKPSYEIIDFANGFNILFGRQRHWDTTADLDRNAPKKTIANRIKT